MITDLYRHYDEQGNLLYVGISFCALARLLAHAAQSPWFPMIATVKIARFKNWEEAESAEREAIRSENPKFNISGVMAPENISPFCPVCGVPQVSAAHILGHSGKGHTSARKKRTSATNGAEGGGRPPGSKDRQPRKPRASKLAA